MTDRPLLSTLLIGAAMLASCAAPSGPPSGPASAGVVLLQGWFDGEEVVYITTDVSDRDVSRAKGANFAPRLADALPAAPDARATPAGARRSSVDKVYAVVNFVQGSVFASAPTPVGPASTSTAYSPLWQLVQVTWRSPAAAKTLKSEEDVLDAAEKGLVTLATTSVVLNCPILQRGSQGALKAGPSGY